MFSSLAEIAAGYVIPDINTINTWAEPHNANGKIGCIFVDFAMNRRLTGYFQALPRTPSLIPTMSPLATTSSASSLATTKC